MSRGINVDLAGRGEEESDHVTQRLAIDSEATGIDKANYNRVLMVWLRILIPFSLCKTNRLRSLSLSTAQKPFYGGSYNESREAVVTFWVDNFDTTCRRRE